MANIDKLIKLAQEQIGNENIHAVIKGVYVTAYFGNSVTRMGIFLATDTRLVVFAKKLIGFELESFPYGKISSIEMSKGLLMGYVMSFYSSGNKVSMMWIDGQKEVQDFVDFIKFKIGKIDSSDISNESIPEQIKKLAELNEQGILTDQEFQDKKQELLAKL